MSTILDKIKTELYALASEHEDDIADAYTKQLIKQKIDAYVYNIWYYRRYPLFTMMLEIEKHFLDNDIDIKEIDERSNRIVEIKESFIGKDEIIIDFPIVLKRIYSLIMDKVINTTVPVLGAC